MARSLRVSGMENIRPTVFNRRQPASPRHRPVGLDPGPGKEFKETVRRSHRNVPMPNILIVDDDEIYLKELEEHFERAAYDVGLLLAANGKQAIRILEEGPVDLVVTGLMMPELDGFELLTYLNNHFPSIPTIVVSKHGTPGVKEKLNRIGSFTFLDKPVQFKTLEDAILRSLQEEHGKGSISGVSIVSFLQMVDSDQKTCLVEARTEGTKPGYLYFNKGELWDAMWEGLTGREAAIEIMGWEHAEIYFKSLPKKKIRKRIESGLMSLIMAALKRKDERSSSGETPAVDIKNVSEITFLNPISEASAEDPEPVLPMELFDESPEETRRVEEAEESPADGEPDIDESTDPLSRALGEFLEIAGVEAVMLVEKDGAVLESSVSSGGIDMAQVGVSVAMVLQGAEKMGGELDISAFQHLMLESESAAIVCAPVGDAFLVLVAHDSQRLGMIRLRMKKRIPEMETHFKNR